MYWAELKRCGFESKKRDNRLKAMTENEECNSYVKTRLFDAKLRDYTEPSLRAESTYSFLNRSSLPEYEGVRRMLERWIDRLPKQQRKRAVAKMRHKGRGSRDEENQFNETFFELFMHEFLVGTGAKVVLEPRINGRTPDFGVIEELPNGSQITYVLEAKDKDLTRGTKLELNQNELLVIDWLNEIFSPEYGLHIAMIGELKLTPSKKHLKGCFEKLLQDAEYEKDLLILKNQLEEQRHDVEEFPKVAFNHGDWTAVGHLIPVSLEYRGKTGRFVAYGPTRGDHIDDIGKTKKDLYKKAKWYKAVDNLVIALRCDSSNTRLQEVLFGSQVVTFNFHNNSTRPGPLSEQQYGQKLDGFWVNSLGPQHQNVIGVAAFFGVHPHYLDKATAVFFENPYVNLVMPEWTKAITHAKYSNGRIAIVEGVSPTTFLNDYVGVGNPFG